MNHPLNDDERALIAEFSEHFVNTGGNDVVQLLERKVDVRTNLPVAMLQVACLSQAQLLVNLRAAGVI